MTLTLARAAAALAALLVLVSGYVLFVGDILVQLGSFRLSAGTWRHPFTQALVLGAIAGGLFYLDARASGKWDAAPRLAGQWVARVIAPVRRQPWLWGGVLTGAIAAFVVCDRLVSQQMVLGSAAGGWTYPFVQAAGPSVFRLAALVSAVACVMVFWRSRGNAVAPEWIQVGAWVLVAMALQVILRTTTPFSLERIFLSEGANSFYTVTQQYGAGTVLSQFAELRGGWPLHAHSNMPGKLMLLYGLEVFTNDPTALAWLMIAISNLAGVLLYLFVRDLFADRRVALYTLILYLFVPAKLYFFPLMNTVTPAVVFACLLCFQRWLQRGSAGYAAAAALSLYVLILFEPVPLVIGALIALLVIRARRLGTVTWTELLRTHARIFMAVFLGSMLLFVVLFGFNLVDGLQRVAADAAAFNASENRPYGLWAWRNLVEFCFGAGICQAVLFVVATVEGLRDRARPLIDRPIVLVCISLAVMLLALDLAGVNRGEAIRLWIFLACLFQIPAAWVCARLDSRLALATVLTLTVFQCALGTATVGFVVP
jgi:hypothetical protein